MRTDAKITMPIARPHLPERDRFMDLVADVFDTRMLSNFGKYSWLLEQRAAEAVGHPRPYCVSSGDVGLTLAWKALGCDGGEVIVPSFTFCSTVNSLAWNNLTPVFADVDPHSFCLDPDEVRRLVTPKTVGIAAVHTYGCPAPVDELESIAREKGLKLIFDAAHGLGADYCGRGIGCCGDASAFSLSGTKIVTGGEGGLVTFRDPIVAERFERLRSYGFIGDYNCREVGLNGKLSELNAGLAWLSLELLPEAVERRTEQVAWYREELEGVTFQRTPEGCVHGYKDFAVLFRGAAERAAAEEGLADRGVQTKRYFFPAHRMAAYAHLPPARLPVTEDLYERVLCLPIFFDLTRDDVRMIARTIRAAVRPQRHHAKPQAAK